MFNHSELNLILDLLKNHSYGNRAEILGVLSPGTVEHKKEKQDFELTTRLIEKIKNLLISEVDCTCQLHETLSL